MTSTDLYRLVSVPAPQRTALHTLSFSMNAGSNLHTSLLSPMVD